MGLAKSATFDEVLEMVDTLPDPLQEELVEIIRRRRLERRRDALVGRVTEARAEYDRGEIRRGTVDDLLEELTE